MRFSETEGLSGQRLALVKRALQRIAADHELTASGHRKKLPRYEAINIAREVCEAVGWNYSYTSPQNGRATPLQLDAREALEP